MGFWHFSVCLINFLYSLRLHSCVSSLTLRNTSFVARIDRLMTVVSSNDVCRVVKQCSYIGKFVDSILESQVKGHTGESIFF